MADPRMTMKDLMAATDRSARTLQHVVTQYELYTGDQIERVKKRHLLVLQFTSKQFEVLQQAVAYVREQQGDYLNFFRGYTTPHQQPSLPESQPLTITAYDWQTFLERFTSLEEKVTAIHTKLETVETKLETVESELSATKATTEQLNEHFLDLATELSNYLLPKLPTSTTS